MGLEWLPRDNEKKNHILFKGEYWGTEAPCTVFEKRPLLDAEGNELARTGYRPGGAEAYVSHLKQLAGGHAEGAASE